MEGGREGGGGGGQETARGEPKPSLKCLPGDGDGGGSRELDGEGLRETQETEEMNRPKSLVMVSIDFGP